MGKKTPLYDQHLMRNARMVEFAGWDMPLHYGSQLEEHKSVRQHAGVFDVSHMNIVEVSGLGAKDFLRYILANDVEKIASGQALYSCMLNEAGGVIDDLIVYQLSTEYYRLIFNAATKQKVMRWLENIQQQQCFHCTISQRKDLAILALQGPHAIKIAESVLSGGFGAKAAGLKPFRFVLSENMLAARTGYTGENGLELVVKNEIASELWRKLLGAGAHPVGLGARDSLRLEAGLNLYGQDMDETTSPLVSNLEWTVAFEPISRDFIGREALQTKVVTQKLVGLMLKAGGVLRSHQKVFSGEREIGVVTSGGFSPVLNCSIALARVLEGDFSEYSVEIRSKRLPVMLTTPVFVRKGKRYFYRIPDSSPCSPFQTI